VIGFSKTIRRVDEDDEAKGLTPGIPFTMNDEVGMTRHATEVMATMLRFFIAPILIP